jgi:Domain of unknown function (DUF4276)
MIIILTEERSMEETIRSLVNRHRPNFAEGLDWFVFSYNGKSDLERNIVTRMRHWNYGEPQFLILRDADGGDCQRIKQDLSALADPCGKPYKIRIVCQELESWFLGDSVAVRSAYPRSRFSNEAAAYRNPDQLGNAAEELARLTGDRTKVGRARLIAPHLSPDRNCSRSFQVFFETLTAGL